MSVKRFFVDANELRGDIATQGLRQLDGEVEVVLLADHEKELLAANQNLVKRVRELEEKSVALRHEAIRDFINGKDKLCLVCGATEPCELKDDINKPCTFDPTPKELLTANQNLVKQVRESEQDATILRDDYRQLQADNARLRERLEGQRHGEQDH